MDLGPEVQTAAGRNSMPAAKAHALSDGSFYVPEIDGLRAVAVGIVMLYHLNFNASVMRGGFVGVDIFFVISGYVVTASLARARCWTPDFRSASALLCEARSSDHPSADRLPIDHIRGKHFIHPQRLA